MGCDIHLYTEYRKDGKWHPADIWVLRRDPEGGDEYWHIPYHLRPFARRDYYFFGWLAGVRAGEMFDPIAANRGLPPDTCDRIRDECGSDRTNMHSHSHVTLQELEKAWEVAERTAFTVPGRAPLFFLCRRQRLSEVLARSYEWLREYLNGVRCEFRVDPADVRAVFWFDN